MERIKLRTTDVDTIIAKLDEILNRMNETDQKLKEILRDLEYIKDKARIL